MPRASSPVRFLAGVDPLGADAGSMVGAADRVPDSLMALVWRRLV
jgi:hypothetical protein